MPNYLVPLEVALIDEGRFVQQANSDLMELQRQLLNYRKKHGEKANGAKATLTMSITLACEKQDESFFSIKSTTKISMPNRPPQVSLAQSGVSQTDEPCLFVRKSGSDELPPAQRKLCTKDGRTINPETGEVEGPPSEEENI